MITITAPATDTSSEPVVFRPNVLATAHRILSPIPVEILAKGTWNSATVALETKTPGTDFYMPREDATFTADGAVVLYVVPGSSIRLTSSNTGTPGPDVDFYLS